MSLRKKAALVGIFSLAIITCVFAIIRVIVISTVTRDSHTTWSSRWNQALWISVEQCVGKRPLFITSDLAIACRHWLDARLQPSSLPAWHLSGPYSHKKRLARTS